MGQKDNAMGRVLALIMDDPILIPDTSELNKSKSDPWTNNKE